VILKASASGAKALVSFPLYAALTGRSSTALTGRSSTALTGRSSTALTGRSFMVPNRRSWPPFFHGAQSAR